MEEEIYLHKKELVKCLICVAIGIVVGIAMLVEQGGFGGESLAVVIVGSILVSLLFGIFIGGAIIGWMKLPSLPFTIGGDAAWIFVGLFIQFIYRFMGAFFLGWAFLLYYLIKDIIFLIVHRTKSE
ncbi:MAG: hypothetical protein LUE12_00365 [Ruminococcus sp.]|nr:hypothetical protein [Ruminococcus sp.]